MLFFWGQHSHGYMTTKIISWILYMYVNITFIFYNIFVIRLIILAVTHLCVNIDVNNSGQLMVTAAAAAAAKSLQSCPTLCDPIDGSSPGCADPGIPQARTLGWVAISFSNAWKWKVKVKSLSRVRLLATPSTAAYQAPPSMGFSRQEHWSGLAPLPI